MSESSFAKGLEGVVAGQTAICTVGREGHSLEYRGYNVNDLAMKATFEEVAYLLLYGELPTKAELAGWNAKLKANRDLPEALEKVLKSIPATAHPMDVLRTGFSYLGVLEPEADDRSNTAALIPRLMAVTPKMVMVWQNHHTGMKYAGDESTDSLAGYFMSLVKGRPATETEKRVLDASLTLYAEHGFNASTFACRVTTGTLSDLYSVAATGIGTLKGPLHGGANEKAMEMISSFKTAPEAEAGTMDLLAKKAKIMGFGHRVYKVKDPRNDVMKPLGLQLAKELGNTDVYPVAEKIDEVMKREKKMFPNVDFYAAPAYFLLGIPIPLYTPIFVIGRMAGWLAHALEQRGDNRLIRPDQEYIGPEAREFVPIEKRA